MNAPHIEGGSEEEEESWTVAFVKYSDEGAERSDENQRAAAAESSRFEIITSGLLPIVQAGIWFVALDGGGGVGAVDEIEGVAGLPPTIGHPAKGDEGGGSAEGDEDAGAMLSG